MRPLPDHAIGTGSMPPYGLLILYAVVALCFSAAIGAGAANYVEWLTTVHVQMHGGKR